MRIYFIAGIYGVGKTSLCRKLAPALAVRHSTASELIRNGADLEDPGEKTISDLPGNQTRLLLALADLRRSEQAILLDGHFCLLAADARIARIPLEVFAAIKPDAILLVEAPVGLVRTRLAQRDGRSYDLALLVDLARQEREQAELVSTSLRVPLRSIACDAPIEEATSFLKSSARSPSS